MVTIDYRKPAASRSPTRGAWFALALLLFINLFNYIDRYVLAAVEPAIQKEFFPDNPADAEAKMGLLATAFIVSYMITAPIFGWLADRGSRWLIIGISVLIWSMATGASGLSHLFIGGFAILFITRLFVGIGEGGYGPAAPTLLSDYFPIERRGIVLSCFYLAIPVGSALGFVIGGLIAEHYGWSSAFYAVVVPGLLMGIACFFFRDPPRGQSANENARKASLKDYTTLLRNRTYVLNSLGMTAMTFAIGGIAFWIPKYLVDHCHAGTLGEVNYKFGLITVVMGFLATLLGGLVTDYLKKWVANSYLLVSGIAALIAAPFVLLMIHSFSPPASPGIVSPAAIHMGWVYLSLSIFFIFFNTGPTNTVLANVTHPSVRATAFALNILIIHALGDAAAPPILGKIGHFSWDKAFQLVALMMALSGAFWLWGSIYLVRDTQAAEVAPVAGELS